ncbi:metal ABC transporter permease [filamentous cyanobacterium LEGE 11480]|uniref:Metal ABC transporter permease n=1 Tax=Romeriopsis navalis LEGE 11480 TaxID=2777977 RepID=A0A928VNX8_9CYAN|nr:metal ABC transporter permease [Romeriopsis navalis]MBE9030191.1 metal ABC transporter permease [Romeriopsis navalis LEGE 11480]
MLHLLLDPWNYQFMQRALVISILIGVLCPALGSYLIVQRMTMIADVVAHCVLPGLSISYFLRLDMLFGAAVSGLCGGFLISWIRTQSRIKSDAAMALTFSTFFSLGIMLITVLKNKIDLDAFLYGNILSVTWLDVWRTGIISAIVLIAIAAFYKELLFYTFDKTGAQAIGLPVNKIYVGFMAAITLTIIASMQAVGVILVVALLTVPALTANLLVKELHHMILLGALIGLFSSVSGVYLSYYQNLPSGPTISLISTGLFLLALLFSPSQGILTQTKLPQTELTKTNLTKTKP